MSSSQPGEQPPPGSRTNPHIRLNSNPADLLSQNSLSISRTRESNIQPSPRRSLIPSGGFSSRQSSGSTTSEFRRIGSSEHLLPPKPTPKVKKYRDAPSRSSSPGPSIASSTRSSFESNYGPFADPLDSPVSSSRAGSIDDEDLNTQTVAQKYNITPSEGLLLYPHDVEKDDYLHNPQPGEKETRDCEIFGRRSLVNMGGLAFLGIGLAILFVIWPVLYAMPHNLFSAEWLRGYEVATRLQYIDRAVYPSGANSCATDPDCLRDNVPLLKNVRTSLIDPKTPTSAYTRKSTKGGTQNLVFSDEFETDGRSFYPGDDPYFTAVDLWYGVTQDLEWYDPDAITTANGTMTIRFDAFENHNLNYRSGMLQSWNQMCFKGGYMEASISLPGAGDTIGFWPGFWSMGNLGRPGYASTTDGLWPYSYWDECDFGITANQSQPDGLSGLPGMRLPACTCSGQDHPNAGKSRTAPEIDALEASVTFLEDGNQAGIGVASQSAQFAPFDIWYQPNYDFVAIYDDSITSMNNYRGGVFQQALSGVTNLNNDWYNGKAYQTYGFEYEPGGTGYTTWFVGENSTWTLDARALGPNGNVGQRVIPQEPMAIVANFGLSNSFANLNMTGLATLMPATMRFDYIRIYQDDTGYIGCDPPDYPTTEYIAAHPDAYNNKDLTRWAETGYAWPNNTFVNDCAA